MTIQGHVVRVTREVGGQFFRYAGAVPEDRLGWHPLDVGQSVLEMAREIALTPDWAYDTMVGTVPPESEEDQEAFFAEVASWGTLARCKEEFEVRFRRWAEYVEGLTDEQLAETKWLPYNGGREHSYLEMLDYPRWNISYHIGQVGYIQTLYGDREDY